MSACPTDFVFPPLLRFGLFDATLKIGGAKAEKLLADTLSITGRGVELAYDNLKNFSERNVQLIQNLLTLINKSHNPSDSKIITDAFAETENDLKNLKITITEN